MYILPVGIYFCTFVGTNVTLCFSKVPVEWKNNVICENIHWFRSQQKSMDPRMTSGECACVCVCVFRGWDGQMKTQNIFSAPPSIPTYLYHSGLNWEENIYGFRFYPSWLLNFSRRTMNCAQLPCCDKQGCVIWQLNLEEKTIRKMGICILILIRSHAVGRGRTVASTTTIEATKAMTTTATWQHEDYWRGGALFALL